jgi:hypothetical protein
MQMQTNLLQSQLMRNAIVITMLTKNLQEAKVDAKGAQLAQSRKHHRSVARSLSTKISKLAAIQKGIKFDLLAQKLAKPVVRTKHGKDDQRYIDWSAQQQQAA